MAREKLPRVPVREQAPEVRAHNFDEVCLGYNKEEAEAEAGKIIELFHKGYQKKQEELQRKQAEEIEAEAQAAAEQIREKYRRETREEWADDETRKAWRSFVNDLVKETEPAEDPGKK